MQEHIRVDIRSHHFLCKAMTPRGGDICKWFAKTYVQWGWVKYGGRFQRVQTKVYGAASKDRFEYRFHINTLDKFKAHLNFHNVTGNQIAWCETVCTDGVDVELVVKPNWTPRDGQQRFINYLNSSEPVNKLIALQTGKGKGFVSMTSLAHWKKRTLIIVKPMYIEKWVKELKQILFIDDADILTVRGSAELMTLLELGKNNLITEKVIIISNKTMQNWIKSYEEFRHDSLDLGYACYPDELCTILGIGVRLIDEIHQDFHLTFKIDMYTNVKTSIGLSATLLSDDVFVSAMQEVMFPIKYRIQTDALDKYIDSFAVTYMLSNPDFIKTTEFGASTYSHMAFEKSILRNKGFTKNYFEIIKYVMDIGFNRVNRNKKKLAVFASSIDMCTQLTAHFKQVYKHLDVRRYVEDDPYENLLDADIRFTTILSAGTAHDIADLTNVLLTIAVSSSQSNIQTLGRLRKLPDSDVQFHYLVCMDIPKHVDYHEKKIEMLFHRAKSFKLLNSDMYV